MDQVVRTYRDLAQRHADLGQAQMRDRFLVLAGDVLYTAGRRDEAERVRAQLLEANPHHLLKPFASWADGMKSPDVQNYVDGLRRTYPPEVAAQLLESVPAPRSGRGTPGAPVVPGQPAAPETYGLRPDGPAPSPAADGAARRPATPVRQTRLPSTSPLWPDIGRTVGAPERPEWDHGPAEGAWLASVLFWLLLAVGAALGFYTLAGPFLGA